MEADINEPSAVEFTYIYSIKALLKMKAFGTTTSWARHRRHLGARDNIVNYKDRFFFYHSEHLGNFRIVSE